jgi:ADP-ribose pyrophosphatase YjhB (NUDIX family)
MNLLERQFTATVYILHDDKVLLHFHAKFGKWLPPGGHLEHNETPQECAKREAFEETGLEIEFVKDEHLWVDYSNATSIERPFLCLLENIPAQGTSPPHQHVDFIFVGTPVGGVLSEAAIRDTQAKWVTLEEVLALTPNEDVFAETQQTIQKIFQWMQTLSIR